jgi:microcystin-dependent protein
MKRLVASVALACALQMTGAGLASAQEQYLGEVRLVGFNFCPTGWMQASGQILSIQQYTALFALYGTNFGGNGSTTFGIPNLNARAAYGWGSPGQPFAAVYGAPQATLTVSNLPSHTHQLFGSSAANSINSGSGGLLATFPTNEKPFAASGSPANVNFATTALGFTGGNQPISTQSPALAMNWCVAYVGIFPSRP